MIESAEFDINAWSHLVDLVVEPPQPRDPIQALKAAQSGKTPPTLRVPLVFTGIYGGPIHLTIEVLDREPDTVTPGWEDVADVSLVLANASSVGKALPRFVAMWQSNL